MGAFELQSGVCFTYEGRLHQVARLLPDGLVRIADLASRAERSVEERALMHAACDGLLTFAADPGATPAGDPAGEGWLDWADYAPRLRAIAEYRQSVILPLLGHRCTARAVQARLREVRAQWADPDGAPVAPTLLRTLSQASVYRWRQRYLACGHDVRALIPRTTARGGKGQRRLGEEEVETIIDQVLGDAYYRNPHTPIKRLRGQVSARITARNAAHPDRPPLRAPSWATMQRRVAALPPPDVLAARDGKRAARRQLRQVGEAPEPERPLERVEIDHLVIPVIVIDERDNLPLGLPVLTYALDVATRYPLGYYLGFEPFSYYAVMECLHHAIRPKDAAAGRQHGCAHDWLAYGVPRELFTDNGREFKGHDLRDACRQLNIQLRHTPVRTPEFKGTIERHFQRLERDLFSELPGAVFAGLRRRRGDDAIQNACLALGDLDRLLYRWIVDVYASEPHAGLGGETPAARWRALTADPFNAVRRAPGSAADLQILLSRNAARTVQRYGIDFKVLRYNCQELGPLRGQTVKVKYHPGDLSRLSVLDPAGGRYITVPALAQQYTQGLTLWTHNLFREQALADRGAVDLAGLRRAREEFEHVITEARNRKRLNVRVARGRTGGAPAGSLAQAPGGAVPVGAAPAGPAPAAAPARRAALEARLAGQTTEAPGWKFGAPARRPAQGPPGRGRGRGGMMATDRPPAADRISPVPAPPPDYIYYPRLDGPAREIRRCLELSRRYGEPYSMALEGVANAGKSAFIYYLMRDFQRDETPELTRIPVVYVELSAPITRNGVGRAILEAFGDPGPYDQLRYDDLTRRVRTLLRACQVRLVILDDFHHLIRNEQIDWEIAEWLKVLIKGAQVPFLVIGIAGKVQRILRANAQLSKLFIVRERLHPLPWDADDDALVEEFGQFVTFVEASVGLRLTGRLDRTPLLGLVHRATGGIVGDIVTFLRYAGAVAGDRGGDRIELADLAHGFAIWLHDHRQAEQGTAQPPMPNPFTTLLDDPASVPAVAARADRDPPEGVNNRSRARKSRRGGR